MQLSNGTQQWIDHLSKYYINYAGEPIKVFKMDKVATQLDELYGESRKGRIYLPPFDINSIYDSNKWVGFLDAGGYSEKEETMNMYINFNEMVTKQTELKKQHVSELFISYTGKGVPSIDKVENILTLYINNVIAIEYDLKDNLYSTTKKLSNAINSNSDWVSRLEGKNDLSINLINFDRLAFIKRETMVYSIDTTYKNITDVIELGDVVMTIRYGLYEVTESKPAGDFGWDYVLWQLGLEVLSVDRIQLPGNYIDQVKANVHGLTKINMEL